MKYLIKMKDSSVAIMTTIDGHKPEDCLAKWHESNLCNVDSHREIDESIIPSNREFRNAWCDVGLSKGIDIDLVKAKDIQLEKLRVVRDAALKGSDGEMMCAMELQDEKEIERLKTLRQGLRDATNALKSLEVSGYNDEKILDEIKRLGTLGV